jgi:hypothetical protein
MPIQDLPVTGLAISELCLCGPYRTQEARKEVSNRQNYSFSCLQKVLNRYQDVRPSAQGGETWVESFPDR